MASPLDHPPTRPPFERDTEDAIWFDRRGLCVAGLHPWPHAEVRKSRQLDLMLTLAFRQRLGAPLVVTVVNAAAESRDGDHAMANLRLALAGLSRIPAANDLPARVDQATRLLSAGMTTADLLEAIERPAENTLVKYDPDQPRVPSGSGRESGRWTVTAAGAVALPRAAFRLASATAVASDFSLFAPKLSAEFLTGLGSLAATIGAAALVGGVLFVPWQKDTSSSGTLPGDTSHTYNYNSDEGLLQIRDASGTVLAAGHADQLGIFHDADTGIAFARRVDGTLVFDGPAVETAHEQVVVAAPGAKALADEDDDEVAPRLCPDPILDQPGSEAASARAKAYQEQISRMINPQRPLPFGLAMGLINPATSKIVHYDECDEQSGTMIEAKGPGFDGLLSFAQGRESVTEDWLGQSLREINAAGIRPVEWYFAEAGAAAYARELFSRERGGRQNIIIKIQPAAGP